MSYEEAHEAILADENEAGEWANRIDERQIKRAYDNSKARSKEEKTKKDDPLQIIVEAYAFPAEETLPRYDWLLAGICYAGRFVVPLREAVPARAAKALSRHCRWPVADSCCTTLLRTDRSGWC